MSVVDEVKAHLDVVEVIGSYLSLQKAGRNFKALCPFHSEKTPSFYVFPDSQRWHCFGACGEGGDIFSFVMKQEGWDFRTALEELARQAGVELRPRTPAQVEAEKKADRLREAMAEAVRYYHHLLRHAPKAAAARAYLDKRALSQETVERFQLGYSLPGWENIRTHLAGQGFTVAELVQAGLLGEREDGTTYDRFRDRLMIPIHDGRGRVIGFGARTLDPEGVPKYMNSPQSPIFDKGRTLFGLHMARDGIRDQGQVVIVEGYMDVMQGNQAGFSNLVAQMGTALTESQVRQLKRYTQRFVLALDPDAAGVQATLRGVEVTRETLDREWEPVFNPRGLVGFEGRLGAEIYVLSLPPGYDPDDLIRSDPEGWTTLVDEALPVVEFYMQTLLDGIDLEDAKERARVVKEMLPLLRDVADPVEREAYAQKLARSLRIDPRTIMSRLWAAERRPAPSPRPEPPSPPQARQNRADMEGYCLAVFLIQPWLLGEVNQVLEELSLSPFQADDLTDPAYRTVFEAWTEQTFDPISPPDELEDLLPETALDRVRMLYEEGEAPAYEQWLREGVQSVLRLRERKLKRMGKELRMLVQDAQEAQQPDAAEYGLALEENARAILQIQQALRTREWIALRVAVGDTRLGEGSA